MAVTGNATPNGNGGPRITPKMLKKQEYFSRIQKAFDEYPRLMLVNADNVGSMQMHQLRAMVRQDSLMIFGKNTQMKRAIREKAEDNPDVEKLIPYLRGNVGLLFTKGDPKTVRDLMVSNKVPAPAKAGAIAQVDVTIPAGLTGMEPTQTNFFQALNIPTKINRGQIEIMSDVKLLIAGQKVGSSEVALLSKMNMKPFSYGLSFLQVFDKGAIFSSDVLDITDEDLEGHVRAGIASIAALSLAIGYPTAASIPHSVFNGLQNLVSISIATDYTIPQAEKLKALLDDPEALAALAAAAAAPAAGEEAEKKEEEPEQEEEEEEEEMEFDLFD